MAKDVHRAMVRFIENAPANGQKNKDHEVFLGNPLVLVDLLCAKWIDVLYGIQLC